ncbi:MAG: nitroreductase family protein [Thermovirgaceae bacterium]
MNFLDLAKNRYSSRMYKTDSVDRKALERCLEAARLAPSACNSQPWKFIVCDSDPLREEIVDQAFSGIYSMNSFAKKAPVIIAVVRQSGQYASKLGGMFRGTDFSLLDIGMACEHFVLQAAEEGLGTCILGWFNEKNVKKLLDLPFSTKVDLLVSLGHPAEKGPRPKHRKDLEEIREYR